VFFGLFTPLQGTPVIGEAVARLSDQPGIEFTMVGRGQDFAASRGAAAGNRGVQWLDWVDPHDLPALVAGHHVCLGIFGTTSKAQRVVPTKVYQGAAAGCAIVTSDTPPQRRALGDSAVLVPAGDARRLADALRQLAEDRSRLSTQRTRARAWSASYSPAAIVAPLRDRLLRSPPP
jgi:glycosyltransferase involved in cell wall biosynthesis